MKVLLTSAEAADLNEPYYYGMNGAEGLRINMPGLPHATMLGRFTSTCFERYNDKATITIQDMGGDIWVCWNEADDIVAILNLHSEFAKYAV